MMFVNSRIDKLAAKNEMQLCTRRTKKTITIGAAVHTILNPVRLPKCILSRKDRTGGRD